MAGMMMARSMRMTLPSRFAEASGLAALSASLNGASPFLLCWFPAFGNLMHEEAIFLWIEICMKIARGSS
jgi:hypothetical protein